jgi:hypothetical protein
MKKVQNKALLLLFVCLLSAPVSSFAFGWDWWNNDDDCNDVPLDGGISLLAAAGIGYGIKKVADKRKKDQKEN